MATNDTLKKQIANRSKQTAPAGEGTSLKALLNSPAIKKRFEEVLEKRAPQFTTSIINLYNSERMLQKSEPMSVISSAMVAASLDLPIDKNLGYAWIVPYYDKNSKTTKAQFQLGYKGYIQLALRSGQYRNINAIPVHEGELKKWNPLTEEIEIDFDAKESDVVIGYAAYFELLNGFRKTVYWKKEHVEQHRQRFSKSGFGWDNDWDAMALKTVIKALLSKWGILSVEMQKAVIEDEEERDRIDVTPEEGADNVIDGAEFTEPVEDPFEEEDAEKQKTEENQEG
ncbi:recombination protein RecT [Bacillus thermophilus]|uniref:Recombination protein RecT n=1 Tax=Siminovitchia thermophila TaxID=1245522 RepID=A0ABS2RDC6_9BACI|nr:recombinase RecT [Siminovitchia thermophila]MBM7717174.1 recombination protein RecT [Siminovitchia thermophila]